VAVHPGRHPGRVTQHAAGQFAAHLSFVHPGRQAGATPTRLSLTTRPAQHEAAQPGAHRDVEQPGRHPITPAHPVPLISGETSLV